MSEGCEKTSVFGEEETGREYKRGLLNHRGRAQGVVVHPALQHGHCVTCLETPTPPWQKLWEEARLHAAGPRGLALTAPGVQGEEFEDSRHRTGVLEGMGSACLHPWLGNGRCCGRTAGMDPGSGQPHVLSHGHGRRLG